MTSPCPVVSVIVPAWNVETYLDETLAAAARQTFADFEVLIVDDASSDRSAEIATEWAERDPRFRLLRHARNRGIVAARNTALAHARGPYVALLDGDDLWTPDALEHRLEIAARFPVADVVATDFTWIGGDVADPTAGRVLMGPEGRKTFGASHASGEPILLVDAFERVATVHFAWVGATLVRRAALDAIGRFDPAFHGPEDTLAWLRLANRGAFAYSPRVTAQYRQRPGSITRIATESKMSGYLKVLEWLSRDPRLAPRRRVIAALTATCHEACATQARSRGEFGRAIRHAWHAVRSAPARPNHWRALTASSVDWILSRSHAAKSHRAPRLRA